MDLDLHLMIHCGQNKQKKINLKETNFTNTEKQVDTQMVITIIMAGISFMPPQKRIKVVSESVSGMYFRRLDPH